jgi:hypothetical protein
MRGVTFLAALLCGLIGQHAVAMDQFVERSSANFDPLALYGPTATYHVFRDGAPVGYHRIAFNRAGDILIVESRSEIEVRVLFLTAYRFSYTAQSRWRDGNLLELDATTNDNGERSVVSVTQADDGLIADGPSGKFTIAPIQAVSEHWWKRFIADEEQLNTITGAVNRVDVDALGAAYVPMASGIALADRFRIGGDIKLESWYDGGRWLGMRFLASDGSTIEYRCHSCSPDMATLNATVEETANSLAP